MSVPEEVVEELRQELFNAPTLVRDYWKSRVQEQEVYFDLTEGLFIGRK
jgi:hypothetical protein